MEPEATGRRRGDKAGVVEQFGVQVTPEVKEDTVGEGASCRRRGADGNARGGRAPQTGTPQRQNLDR
ncbi:MAG TPA: hypothetical protein DCE44_20805, partial [Verrucomicrobiales bacterium]|nr:hypothetical protein [Verrucomicrobiales bacterium]